MYMPLRKMYVKKWLWHKYLALIKYKNEMTIELAHRSFLSQYSLIRNVILKSVFGEGVVEESIIV